MKDRFVMTNSARKFYDGIEHITHKLKGIERMLLVIGEPGLGKTEAALHYCAVNSGILIRTLELMSGPWLLRTIVFELGMSPFHRSDKNIDIICETLLNKPRVIIFDEVDRFIRKPEILETLRDIHDISHAPLVFIGEDLADKQLKQNRRLYRRFIEVVRFEKLDLDGVRQFISETSDIKYEDAAIEKIAANTNGKISDIMTAVHRAERIAKTSGAKLIGAKDFK